MKFLEFLKGKQKDDSVMPVADSDREMFEQLNAVFHEKDIV